MSKSFTCLDKLVENVKPAKVIHSQTKPIKEKIMLDAQKEQNDEILIKINDFNDIIDKPKKVKKIQSTSKLFDFMEGWKINIDKLPQYLEFRNNIFYEEIDKMILMFLLKDKSIADEQKIQLNRLLSKIKHNVIEVKYVQLMKESNIGRFYSEDNISIIPLCKKIKHTVFKYLNYTDFDMVSCHQSIALSIAEINNVELPAISMYMFNKEKITKEEIEFYSMAEQEKVTSEDIKYKFNMMAYGGSEEAWRHDIKHGYNNNVKKIIKDSESPFTKEFKNDINKIQKLVYENNKDLFEKIYTKHKDLTKKEEINKNKRTLLSCFFQIIENHILYIAFQCLQYNKIIKKTNVCLEYDGLCVPTDKFDKDRVIYNLNKKIVEITGLKFIKFKIKNYEHAINEIIEKRRSIDKETCYVSNDLDAAKKVYRLFPYWVYCNKELYVFDRDTGLWSTDEMIYFKIISEYEDYLYTINEKGIISSNKSYGNTGVLTKKIIEMIKTVI